MAPPSWSRCSTSSTDSPMPASSTAAATPAGPPPTVSTSGCHTMHLEVWQRSRSELHCGAHRGQTGFHRCRAIDRHQTGLAGPDATKIASAQLPHGWPQVLHTTASQGGRKALPGPEIHRMPLPEKYICRHDPRLFIEQFQFATKQIAHGSQLQCCWESGGASLVVFALLRCSWPKPWTPRSGPNCLGAASARPQNPNEQTRIKP